MYAPDQDPRDDASSRFISDVETIRARARQRKDMPVPKLDFFFAVVVEFEIFFKRVNLVLQRTHIYILKFFLSFCQTSKYSGCSAEVSIANRVGRMM